MPEQTQSVAATYLPEIECSVRDGSASWEIVAGVRDEKNREQFLSVSKGMVSNVGGKSYLSVGVVQIDHAGRRVLVELPTESDSGVSRLWVPFTSFRKGE